MAVAAAAGLALGAVKTGIGIVEKIASKSKLKKLRRKRKAFETEDEVYDIRNATQSMASSGYDPATLNYLTNQIDRGFSSSVGAATRMGGDPNSLASLFDQKIQSIMKVGAENAALNMQNFSRYLSALDLVSKNKEAEWASEQGFIKDDMQAAAVDVSNAQKEINAGINLGLGSLSSMEAEKLYKEERRMTGQGSQPPVTKKEMDALAPYLSILMKAI
jgi:hypothetical protein